MLKLGLEKVGIKIFKKLPECWGESGVNSRMFDSANVMEKMIKWVGWDESLLHIFAKRLGCDIWIYLDGSCVGVNCSCDVQCLDQFGPFPSPSYNLGWNPPLTIHHSLSSQSCFQQNSS